MATLSTIVTNWPAILAALGSIVATLQLLVPILQTLAGIFAKLGLMTATKADDAAVSKVSAALSAVAQGLTTVERFLPRASLRPPHDTGAFVVKSTIAAAVLQNTAKPSDPPPSEGK